MFAATASSPRSVRATPFNRSTPLDRAYMPASGSSSARIGARAAHVYDLPLYAGPRRTEPAVFVRRQVVALLIAAIVLGALSFGLRSAVGALTADPASGGEGVAASIAPAAGVDGVARSASTGSATAARVTTYVVQPGDTLWTIARALQPTGDPGALVQELAKANGGTALDAGDVLIIP